jgi:hypothetical protein
MVKTKPTSQIKRQDTKTNTGQEKTQDKKIKQNKKDKTKKKDKSIQNRVKRYRRDQKRERERGRPAICNM